jgi:ThiF family
MLERAGGEIQIGVDSASALIFTEPRLAPVLRTLDGAHHLQTIRDAGIAEGLPEGQVDEALHVLAESHMLVEGGRGVRAPVAMSGQSVLLIGAGVLGQNIARLLSQSPIGHLWLVDNERPEPNVHPQHGAPTTRAEALQAMVSQKSEAVVHSASHWTQPFHPPPDLTIIACETVEADRLVAADLLRADQPHLVVRSAGEAVIVGPLVIPGRTACVACTDLTRRDTDPGWPALLDQLTRLRLPASGLLNSWAACLAATQALAFLRTGIPESCGATIELNEHDLLTRWRTWMPHPGCGCHWFLTREWGHEW